jgi:hypothetical protein
MESVSLFEGIAGLVTTVLPLASFPETTTVWEDEA